MSSHRPMVSVSNFFFAAMLIASLMFQIVIIRPLQHQVAEHGKRVHDLEEQLGALVNHSTPLVKPVEAVQAVPVKSEDVVKGEDYHSYKIPKNPHQTFTYDDFEEKFKVKPLHHVLFDPDIVAGLDAHDIRKDEMYKLDPEGYESKGKLYGDFIDLGSHEKRDREYFVVKWSSPEMGYGLFARKFIAKDEIVGLYTGYVSRDGIDTDYMWTYETHYADPHNYDLGVDSLTMGNYMRFVNHAGKDLNTRVEMVPYKNRWWVLYVADSDIFPGQELFTDYGPEYFTSRGLEG